MKKIPLIFLSKSDEKSCLITLVKIRSESLRKNTHYWVFFVSQGVKFSTLLTLNETK